MTPEQLTFRNPLTSASVDACLAVLVADWPKQLAARVFDVGCGNGEALARLRELRHAQRAADCIVLGIDPDGAALARAALRHAALPIEQAEEARWEARDWAPELAQAGPWQAAFCLGSRHAFGSTAAARDQMLQELSQRTEAGARLFIADGYWRVPPASEYLEASGMQADELIELPAWHARFEAHGLRLLHEECASPEDFEAFERVFWAQGGAHWEAWSQAFLRWGKQTMGFAAWVLAVD
jgi:SAM-dependent methyltransferase